MTITDNVQVPQQYRKNPVVIEAMRVPRRDELGSWGVISGWLMGHGVDFMIAGPDGGGVDGIDIRTLEGTMRADIGDFVIRGVQGEFYPCKPDIFAATYEAVES